MGCNDMGISPLLGFIVDRKSLSVHVITYYLSHNLLLHATAAYAYIR
jgi:hypothetical protein